MKQCRYSLNNRKAFSTDKTLQQSMEETQHSQQGAETQSESHSDEQYKYSLNNMKTFSIVKTLY